MIYSIKKKLFSRGFTLIELLVVIAIIGVLATVVLASLNTARRKSRDARRISDIKQLQLALELHFDGAGAGNYPLANSTACDGTPANVYGLDVLVSGGYIAAIPRDPNAPTASACYRYASIVGGPAGARTLYHLAAVLEDPANTALTSDRDCDDATGAGTPSCGSTTAGVGVRIQGATIDCVGGSGADRCYDVTP